MTTIDLSKLTLRYGPHLNRDSGLCTMEAVAWLANEEHSDRPACACPVVGAFVRKLNDKLPDDSTRTRLLRPLVPRLVGSKSTRDVALRRGYLAVDWAVRMAAPRALGVLGRSELVEQTNLLRMLPEVVDIATARVAVEAAARASNVAAYALAAFASGIAGDAANAADYLSYERSFDTANAEAAVGYVVQAARALPWEASVKLIERMLDIKENT